MIMERSRPSQNKASNLMFRCIGVVSESLLAQVSCIATHGFNQALRCTKIPVAEARRWMHIGVNDTSRDVVALVSGTSQSYGLHVAN